MAYCKAQLKNNGDKAFPYFKPFLIGNMSDKFAYPDSSVGFIQTFLLALQMLVCHTQ
jgi:hypothetical protein